MHNAYDDDGRVINGRHAYVYEFSSFEEAKYCEAVFQIGVKEKFFFAQLYVRGTKLFLDVPGSAVGLVDVLYKKSSKYSMQ